MASPRIWRTPIARSGAIVANRNLDASIVVVNLHVCLGGTRMSNDVRQCLPGDAIYRRSSLARNRLKIIRKSEVDGKTSGARGLDQIR
jgi:hypothetical protein